MAFATDMLVGGPVNKMESSLRQLEDRVSALETKIKVMEEDATTQRGAILEIRNHNHALRMRDIISPSGSIPAHDSGAMEIELPSVSTREITVSSTAGRASNHHSRSSESGLGRSWSLELARLTERVTSAVSGLRESIPRSDTSGSWETQEWVGSWLNRAQWGELDVYTCLSLCDAGFLSQEAITLRAKVVTSLVLQLFVPSMMIFIDVQQGLEWDSEANPGTFRCVAFILFVFSIYGMHLNSVDECRLQLLRFSFAHQLSVRTWSPLVLGEFSNSLASTGLSVVLFTVLKNSLTVNDLLVNATAIHFIGHVDTMIVDDTMKENAIKGFAKIIASNQLGSRSSSSLRSWDVWRIHRLVEHCVLTLMWASAAICGWALLFDYDLHDLKKVKVAK